MTPQGTNAGTGVEVPYLNSFIIRSGDDEFAVKGDGNRTNWAGVPFQSSE